MFTILNITKKKRMLDSNPRSEYKINQHRSAGKHSVF